MMNTVSILDYGCGNILSLKRAINELGFNVKLCRDEKDLKDTNFLILPGVGAFENAMNLLKKNNFIDAIKEYCLIKKKPMLGICLGMQLLLTKSYEMGENQGLNIIEGENIFLKNKLKDKKFKIPHIGWEEIYFSKKKLSKSLMLKEFEQKSFYYVHSYIASLKNQENLIAYSVYHDIKIPAIIQFNNIMGFQFHPEKSGINGLKLLKTTLETI